MNTGSIDSRITALARDFNEEIRLGIQRSLKTLRAGENVPGSIVSTSLMLEGKRGLLVAIAAPIGYKLKGSQLIRQIDELTKAELIPEEIASCMHLIRVYGNKARHSAAATTLTDNDAEVCLDRALSVIEWFGCRYEHGPGLQTIYSTLPECWSQLQKPTPEQTRSLEAEIALIHETLRRQSERSQEATRDPVPIPLPTLRGTFVDREVERDTLHHLLREGDMRLVVIVAPGGYGKTELTTKILKEVAPNTSIIDPNLQGILYLRCLRGDVTLGRIFAEAGRIAGSREAFQQIYADCDLTLERKLEYFFNRLSDAGNVWLVMDNLEDLLADDDSIIDAELRAFIEAAAATEHKMRLIATTRAVPRFSGSQRLKRIDLSEGLPEGEAIKYLRTDGASCGLAEVDEDLLRRFVNRVHRIPKALESIIGYLHEKYPTVELSDLLANDALFADFDRYDMDNGLKRLVAEQFMDQTPDARLVLCALSIFPKPAPLGALHYLLPALDSARVLPRLERNRLISRQGDRYDLHPLIRECAYGHITEGIPFTTTYGEVVPDDRATTAENQASGLGAEPFTRRVLHRRAADLCQEIQRPRDQWKTLDDLEPHLDEFYHRVRAGQYDEACLLFNDIDSDFLTLWGSYARIVELRSELAVHLIDPLRRLENYGELGNAWHYVGEVDQARNCFAEALALARELGDRKQESVYLGALGETYDLDEAEESIELHTKALEIARDIHDRQIEAEHLSSLGLIYDWMGDAQKAITYFNDSLQIARQIDDRENVGVQLGYLGIAYQDFRDIRKAIHHYQAALEIAEELDDHSSKAVHLCNLGSAYRAIGMMQEAINCHQESRRISRKIGYHLGEGRDPECLGLVYQALGDLEKAMACYKEALALDIDTDDKWGQGLDLEHMGRAYLEMGDNQMARQSLEKALALGIQVNVREDQYEALVGLGMVYHNEGNLVDAHRCYTDAVKLQIPKSHYSCEPRLGILCLEEEEPAKAEEHFSRGIEMCQTLLAKTPNLCDALYHLALTQLGRGQPDEAIATYRRALDVCSAKGIVQSALQDLALVKRVAHPVAGLSEAGAMLLLAIG